MSHEPHGHQDEPGRKGTLAWVRLVLLLLLVSWGLQQAWGMRQDLGRIQGSPWAFLGVAVACFGSLWVQAWMTRTIVGYCNAKVSAWHCCSMNVMGGLWGLLLPLGSIGYKAAHLKRYMGVSLKDYSSMYGLSLLSTLLSGSLVLVPTFYIMGKEQWSLYALAMLLGLLVLSSLGAKSLVALMTRLGQRERFGVLLHGDAPKRVVRMGLIQTVGLMIYVWGYHFWFMAVGVDVAMVSLIVFVILQSWIFLAPLVPGNLVVLETLGVLWLGHEGVAAPDALTVVAGMRLSMLLLLLAMSPVAAHGLKGRPVRERAEPSP